MRLCEDPPERDDVFAGDNQARDIAPDVQRDSDDSDGSDIGEYELSTTCDSDDNNGEQDQVLVTELVLSAKQAQVRPRHEWILVGEFTTFDLAKDFTAPSTILSTRQARCTVCLGSGEHKMCSRYLNCVCREGCLKKLKILCCGTSGLAVAYKRAQYGECLPPPPCAMSRTIRNQADRLFAEGITPSRVQHRMKASVPAAAMPHVKAFQNRARHYRKVVLREHSDPAEMARMLAMRKFNMARGDTEFFSFGYDVVEGVPRIGYGGPSGVFKVGITTKSLVLGMNRPPSSFVFHWDATYKINSMAYPVLICGMTDPGGKFHPVAFYLIGEESTDEYQWAMEELMKVYAAVAGSPLQLDYVMADAAKAPVTAMKNLQDELGIKTLLMCFYHCVACVFKRLGAVSAIVKALVSRHLFKMHYSRSYDEYQLHWTEAKVAWSGSDALVAKGFLEYFTAQWVASECSKWQVYHTPPGFPTTNNPCELFNKHLKGTYTQRSVHGLCATFDLLGSIAEDLSTFKAQPFELSPSPSIKLQQRVKRLAKHGLLRIVPPTPDIESSPTRMNVEGVIPQFAIAMAIAFEDEADGNALIDELRSQGVTSMPPQDLALANAYYYNDRANNVRHESICSGHKQPWYGWGVCTAEGKLACECNYFFKRKYCCHLLFALQNQHKDFRGVALPPANFVRNKSKRGDTAPRFSGKRRGSGLGTRSGRRRRTVGPPLAMT